MNRRLTILMCADLVGYSALMGEDEALAVQSVRDLKQRLLEPVAANHGGEVLKRMGDGWILAFPGVEAALNCAEEVQTGLAEHEVIKLRIGCHIGEIVEDEDDFYGNGVNIAQRIETEAPPGGVMLSEDLFRQLSENRQSNLNDAGMFNLKNIATPMRLYQWRPANLTTAPDAGALPSIAIEAISFAPATPDNEALAMDLHEGIVQQSVKRTGITTVDAAQDPDTPTIFLLRGRLRISGTRGRFTVSLMMRDDMSMIWSGTYEGDTSDVFAFCDDVLARAESDIRLQTVQHDGDRLIHLRDEQLSVSELRARAANLFFRQDLESWQAGYDALDRAVALSPRDGMSLAMRAHSRINNWGINFEDTTDELKASLGRDLDLAVAEHPPSDFVFWSRGSYKLRLCDDIEGARFDMRRSLDANPNFLGGADLGANIALRENRFREALEIFEAFDALGADNPFKLSRLCFRTRLKLSDGDLEGALRDATEAAYLAPTDRAVQLLRALVCLKAGDQPGLDAARNSAVELTKGPSVLIQKLPFSPEFQWINDALHPDADPV
ncbi:adenylate/guanylate cyclase domain-containing protein [Shimia abyssi]|uniref:Class 3 adenylate cyclase n=1 Tax=Shimia abyssi TaxID=1662395 RepID=A0A2P8FGP3_9RHOB|nr:adenylate/guanylate cyclase domain-containing protein [Shimia abyssi]PSL20893.1 class 3 adenylate cyclase [Shimia abyssi]